MSRIGANNKEPLVSVIVPVYNVEKYLRRCLDSIVGQTYKNLEIILVDDGSTDGSGGICDEYGKKDGRIRVLHRENQGVAESRNIGISKAKGEYLTQIDADDWVDNTYVQFLLAQTSDGKFDIATCGEYLVCDDRKDMINMRKGKFGNTEFVSPENAVKNMFYQRKLNTSAWGKIYRRRLFEGVRYPAGRTYEDLSVTYKVLLKCKTKICISPRKLYYYRQRHGSISRQDFSAGTLDSIIAVEQIANEVYTTHPELTSAVDSRRLNAYFFVLRQINKRKNSKDYKKLVGKIATLRKKVLKDPEVRMKTKGGILLSYISYDLIPIMFKIIGWTKMMRNLE